MSFSSVPNSEKLNALSAALVDLRTQLYNVVARLGVDPDSYDLSAFVFDPNSNEDSDEQFLIKRQMHAVLQRIQIIESKINQLS